MMRGDRRDARRIARDTALWRPQSRRIYPHWIKKPREGSRATPDRASRSRYTSALSGTRWQVPD